MMKSLKELWDENGQKPFDAVSRDHGRFHCLGFAPNGVAVGWDIDEGGSDYWESSAKLWSLIKPEPKLVPHWFAVEPSGWLSSRVYPSPDVAKACLNILNIRLVTEWPPIMLPEKE